MKFLPEDDGVTHINIYSKGKTQIGRWLSNFTYFPINIAEHGRFNSIEGYWYWLRTKDDRLRKLSGYEAKKYGKSLIINEAVDGNFILNIKNAIDIKLKTNRNKMIGFCLTDLPFTHYYVFGGVKRNAGFEWIVEHFEDRRKLLKEWYLKISTR